MDLRILAIVGVVLSLGTYLGVRKYENYQAIKHQAVADAAQDATIHADITAIGALDKIGNAVKDGIHGTVIQVEGKAYRVTGATEKALKEFHDNISKSKLATETKAAMTDGVHAFLHAAQAIGLQRSD